MQGLVAEDLTTALAGGAGWGLVTGRLQGAQAGLRSAEDAPGCACSGFLRTWISISPATHFLRVQGICVLFWNRPSESLEEWPWRLRKPRYFKPKGCVNYLLIL